MSKLPHQGPTPKCCVRVPGLSDGRHTTLCHRRFWHHHLGQGQLSNTGADGYADPAVSREVTVHRRFDLLTGQGLNLLDLVVEGQGLVKAVDDGQFVAHIQVAGRELWQRPHQELLDVVQFGFAGSVLQVLGKQGFDMNQGALAVARGGIEADDPGGWSLRMGNLR